ncbi:Sigma-70, region 4 [Nonomuraea maritima]|uniref:Sigma-70, region 4 n=1 Tax=Nonomuraea maritima TaxID=683260 RepID=A0A1G9MIF2_9ACTN|nr:sigma factor-like helix-turn-helix DNA-binding protein [Nonomuraea maritima]SDL73989.1 Sigma-70, region 4 [Nonomuraea maritima]
MQTYEAGRPVELDARERLILVYRLVAAEPLSRKQLGAVLGISDARVRQLESKLMSKLRFGLTVEFPASEQYEVPAPRDLPR